MNTFPEASSIDRLSNMDLGGGSGLFLGTSVTTSPIITTVTPTPINVLPGSVVAIPSGVGTFYTFGTVLSVTANSITLTANAAGAITGTGFVVIPPKAGVLQGNIFHLASAAFTPGWSTTLASLTAIEATFAGYAAIALQLTGGVIEAQVPVVQSQLLRWVGVNNVTPNTIYGWWIDDGTNVLCADVLATPVAIAQLGDTLAGIFQDSFPTLYGFQQVTP